MILLVVLVLAFACPFISEYAFPLIPISNHMGISYLRGLYTLNHNGKIQLFKGALFCGIFYVVISF